jgi:hypothetical protein
MGLSLIPFQARGKRVAGPDANGVRQDAISGPKRTWISGLRPTPQHRRSQAAAAAASCGVIRPACATSVGWDRPRAK